MSHGFSPPSIHSLSLFVVSGCRVPLSVQSLMEISKLREIEEVVSRGTQCGLTV